MAVYLIDITQSLVLVLVNVDYTEPPMLQSMSHSIIHIQFQTEFLLEMLLVASP